MQIKSQQSGVSSVLPSGDIKILKAFNSALRCDLAIKCHVAFAFAANPNNILVATDSLMPLESVYVFRTLCRDTKTDTTALCTILSEQSQKLFFSACCPYRDSRTDFISDDAQSESNRYHKSRNLAVWQLWWFLSSSAYRNVSQQFQKSLQYLLNTFQNFAETRFRGR